MEGGCLSQREKEEVAGACSLSGGPTRRDSLTHHPALPVGCQERQPAEVTHAVREEEEENSVGTRGPRSGTSGASGWIPSGLQSKEVASEMSRGGTWLDPLNRGF